MNKQAILQDGSPKIGLPKAERTEAALMLTQLLCDEHVLYIKTRNYHWNVTGLHFGPLHAMFQTQYEQLEPIIDETAERIRQIGMFAKGSMQEFLEGTSLTENSTGHITDIQMLANLLADHETIIRNLRSDIEKLDAADAGTQDFFISTLEMHEKTAWMLRAHLQR